MKTSAKSVLLTLTTVALCSTADARTAIVRRAPVRPALVQPAQPEMNQAIIQLEEAKHSRQPIEHLERAKNDLQDAKHNKAGERVEAIKHVNEAIEAARKHNHKAMEVHIDAAIRDIRQGKHAARR